MAHHSGNRVSADLAAMFRNDKLGPTGKFPEGKLVPSDEGEIRVGITHIDGNVVIDFGKPTAWIGFTPEQAMEIATTLQLHAATVIAERNQS